MTLYFYIKSTTLVAVHQLFLCWDRILIEQITLRKQNDNIFFLIFNLQLGSSSSFHSCRSSWVLKIKVKEVINRPRTLQMKSTLSNSMFHLRIKWLKKTRHDINLNEITRFERRFSCHRHIQWAQDTFEKGNSFSRWIWKRESKQIWNWKNT